jgi:hypothetical protein
VARKQEEKEALARDQDAEKAERAAKQDELRQAFSLSDPSKRRRLAG